MAYHNAAAQVGKRTPPYSKTTPVLKPDFVFVVGQSTDRHRIHLLIEDGTFKNSTSRILGIAYERGRRKQRERAKEMDLRRGKAARRKLE